MFNKSKKYGIVKCLPFICFANINAEAFESGEDQIKVVVDNETYVLAEGCKINNDINANININADILAFKNSWDNGEDDDYNLNLPGNLKDNEKYKLVSYILNGIEEKDITKLSSIQYKNIKSSLTLNFESIYKIADDSKLSDGKNEIDISGTPILYSELKELSTVKKLEEFIKAKFQEKVFGDIVEGCLKNIKIENIDFDKFFIEECKDFGELDDSAVSTKVTKKIKKGEPLEITFKPYFKYTIEDIKLSEELAKKRKLKDNLVDVKKIFNEKYGKLVGKISLEDIQNFIKDHSNEKFKKIEIANANDDNDKEPDELKSIEVTSDEGNIVSDVMKGTIKFTYDNTKLKPLNKGTGSNKFVEKIDFKFSIPNKIFDKELSIFTTTTKDNIIASIKKYLGVADDNMYEVTYNKGFDDKRVTGDFKITVKLKDIIPNFTAELDKADINVQVKFKIENDDDNYELSCPSDKNFTLINVNVYDDFITVLKGELKNIDNEIKEVKIGTTNIVWSSDTEKTKQLQTFLTNLADKVIEVTVTLNKSDNGTYVKKKATPPSEPPAEEKTKYTLKVSCVQGYKLKDSTIKTVDVTLENSKLTANELYAKVKQALDNDDNFIIKKGNNKVENDNNNLENNPNAYSVEILQGSSLIEEDKKDDDNDGKDKKEEQTGDKPTEKKGCCGGKCYGGDKKNK